MVSGDLATRGINLILSEQVGIATSKQAFQQQHIRHLSNEMGDLSMWDKVTCKVNYERRKLIANNHTCAYVEYFPEERKALVLLGFDAAQFIRTLLVSWETEVSGFFCGGSRNSSSSSEHNDIFFEGKRTACPYI
ncbi:hypothetical protein ISN44_As10g010370 [Arabidopsis suecica]|uniref:Uncharacterized protein n=1 Tax=Arabidopsis suecica TaxID=45249 RepID=A0A8T1ZTW2_ARASU|nr:hypothetical protein ISN44_As10g010370 [Arabidopsis suecica]